MLRGNYIIYFKSLDGMGHVIFVFFAGTISCRRGFCNNLQVATTLLPYLSALIGFDFDQ